MTAQTPEPPKDPESSTSSAPAQPRPVAKPVTSAESQAPAADRTAQPAAPTTAETKATPAKAPAPPKAPPPKVNAPLKTRTPAVRRTGAGSGGAVVVSVVSLLIALGAISVAIYALDVAREAKSQAAGAVSGAQRPPAVAPSPSGPAAVAPPTASPTPTPPPLVVEFNQALGIPPTNGCASMFVDVDTFQTGTYAGHDFYVSNCLGRHTVRVDRNDGAILLTPPNTTPEACWTQLRAAPAVQEREWDLHTGLVFCQLTSRVDAAQQRISQRLAIVEIRAIAPDLTVTAGVTTYRLPNTGPA